MTDPLGQSQVLPYIILLSKKNYNFHLVSYEKTDRYSKYHSLIEKICVDNKIQWYPLKYNKKLIIPIAKTAGLAYTRNGSFSFFILI